MDLVEDVEPDPPLPLISQVSPERKRELEKSCREALREVMDEMEREKNRCCPGLDAQDAGSEIVNGRREGLGSSGDEDVIIGGVIVASGASTKRKNAARRRKRKLLRLEREEEEMKSRW